MKQRSALSENVAVLLLALIAIGTSLIVYIWSTSFISNSESAILSQKELSLIKIEHVSALPSGGIAIYVRNIGDRETYINTIYIKELGRESIRKTYYVNTELKPHEISKIIIPALELSRINVSEMELIIGSVKGVTIKLGAIRNTAIHGVEAERSTYICLQAFRYSDYRKHWVVFDYIAGKYWFYDKTYNVLKGPYVGYAPILRNISEYTIASTWTPWSKRPIDSPILIVINPTRARENWVFTWHDPHGVFRFHLQRLSGDVEIDFLVFWEDLFNPYYPPGKVDDWKDHVVRITVFTNGTFRIAVFMAKGGYRQVFYLNVPKNMFSNVESLSPIYAKPYGAYWNVKVEVYEMEDKVFYVKI